MIYLFRAQQAAGFELRVVPGEPDLTVSTDRMLDGDRRDDGGRRVLARAVPHVVHHGRGRDHPPRARGRRDVDPRHLSVGRHHSGGRAGARRRLRGRRLPEVAVRRPGQRVPLHAAGSPARREAVVHRLAVARAPVRFRRSGDVADARRRDAHDERHAVDSRRTTRRSPGSTSSTRSASIASATASNAHDGAAADAGRRYGFTSAASRNPDRLAGTVAVNVPDAPLVSRTLKARDFIVDYRPPVGIRISPHFYNTMDEIDRVMAEIAVDHREEGLRRRRQRRV